MLSRISWIQDLVKAEEQMDEVGVVDLSHQLNPQHAMIRESISLLQSLKDGFVEAANAFNELKSSALGRVKIYGIANTKADFMLFRNGFKMIFALKDPGTISIRFNFIAPANYGSQQNGLLPTLNMTENLTEEYLLTAKPAPFGDITWTFNDQSVKLENVIRHQFTLFIKESTR